MPPALVVAVVLTSPLKLTIEPPRGGWAVRDDEIPFEWVLTNDSAEMIQLPVEYLRRRGPDVELRDGRTKRTIHLRIPLRSPVAEADWAPLAPRASVWLPWHLFADEARPLGPELDLSVRLVVATAYRHGDRETPVKLEASSRLKLRLPAQER